MCPRQLGQIHTSVQAGGMTRDRMRNSSSASVTRFPSGPTYSNPLPCRRRVMPGRLRLTYTSPASCAEAIASGAAGWTGVAVGFDMEAMTSPERFSAAPAGAGCSARDTDPARPSGAALNRDCPRRRVLLSLHRRGDLVVPRGGGLVALARELRL